MLMQETKTFGLLIESKKIFKTIKEIKSDLVKAINLLELNLCDEDTLHPHYFLDFAILMALYYLQLYFVERVMSGEKKFRRKVEDYIFYD